jgi:hypothetical protein
MSLLLALAGASGSTVTGDGSAAGIGDALAVGASTAAADGATAGLSTALAVGASTAAGEGACAGLGDATATGSSVAAADGAAAGTSTALAVGASTAVADGADAGVGSASGVGAATAAADGASDGASTASGVGASTAAGDGASDGIGTADAVGATLSAVRLSWIHACSAVVAAGVGNAAGTSPVVGVSGEPAPEPVPETARSGPGYKHNPRDLTDPFLDQVREKWRAIEALAPSEPTPEIQPGRDETLTPGIPASGQTDETDETSATPYPDALTVIARASAPPASPAGHPGRGAGTKLPDELFALTVTAKQKARRRDDESVMALLQMLIDDGGPLPPDRDEEALLFILSEIV